MYFDFSLSCHYLPFSISITTFSTYVNIFFNQILMCISVTVSYLPELLCQYEIGNHKQTLYVDDIQIFAHIY